MKEKEKLISLNDILFWITFDLCIIAGILSILNLRYFSFSYTGIMKYLINNSTAIFLYLITLTVMKIRNSFIELAVIKNNPSLFTDNMVIYIKAIQILKWKIVKTIYTLICGIIILKILPYFQYSFSEGFYMWIPYIIPIVCGYIIFHAIKPR